VRFFVAIPLPQPATDSLSQLRTRLEPAAGPGLRWSASEAWHVTLQFLGAAGAEQAGCVTAQLRQVRSPPVPVRLSGLGFFEGAGVFHAAIALTPELLTLEQRVTAATRLCGFVPEPRPWHPHITLARAKGRTRRGALALLKKTLQRSPLTLETEFAAAEFLLYESFPAPEGSRYEVRARFALDAEP
jgi:RNA 2',3'-cyclic 3'-phosphodiesterase